MNRPITLVLVAIFFSFPFLISATDFTPKKAKKYVAIYVNVEKDKKGWDKVFTHKLNSALLKSEQYRLLERNDEFIASLEKEKDQIINNTDEIIKIGREKGATLVLIADIVGVSGLGSTYLTAKFINVETKEILDTEGGGDSIGSLEQLEQIAGKIANQLINKSNSVITVVNENSSHNGLNSKFKYAIYDFNKVKQDWEAYKDFEKKTQELSNQKDAEYRNLEKKLKEMSQDHRYTPEDLREQSEKIQSFYQEASQYVSNYSQSILSNLTKKLETHIKKISRQNGYVLIFEKNVPLYYSSEIEDITKSLINSLNSNYEY